MHRWKPISRIRRIHSAKCCDMPETMRASIEHYSAALKITPNFYSSNVGIGDTRTLMGDYAGARAQYDKVIAAATNPRDKLHAQFQKSLTYFWEGQPEEGRKALHATLESARHQKEPYEQFEAGLALAQLSENNASALEQLKAVETSIEKPVAGMSEPDRNVSLAQVLREEARYASANSQPEVAQDAISKLERYAAIYARPDRRKQLRIGPWIRVVRARRFCKRGR